MQMLSEERRRVILERLQRDGKVLAHDLSAVLGVSEDTIRRDLRELADAGLLQRVHGGALPKSPSATISYAAREQQAMPAKQEIARTAAQLLRNGQVIILDSGTTTLQVAQQLAPDLRATVITHSPPIVVALAAHTNVDVVVIGGQLHKASFVALGAATVEAYRAIRADVCLLGVAGAHPEFGISVMGLEESYVKRAIVANSTEVIALASADKLGTAAPYVIGPLSELTHIVTERAVTHETLAPYRAAGITIVQG
jgi:DeoR/GlpR family transcriptional regulator of sugar metabolism